MRVLENFFNGADTTVRFSFALASLSLWMPGLWGPEGCACILKRPSGRSGTEGDRTEIWGKAWNFNGFLQQPRTSFR